MWLDVVIEILAKPRATDFEDYRKFGARVTIGDERLDADAIKPDFLLLLFHRASSKEKSRGMFPARRVRN
jgi:hypothetical protein